ncbi:MAG: zinc ribbon domain-containing protein [Terriglobales bacterium]
MSGAAHNLDQEYWRPPVQQNTPGTAVRPTTEVCPRCNSEYALGARFCHVCGAEREPQAASADTDRITRFLDFHIIMNSLGMTVGALVAFIVGIGCAIAAAATGFIYTATTALDWQAVQLWRIEWLLAAVAAFAAGILLKRTA